MSNELWIAVVAGLSGMLGWGSADFFAKKTIDKIGPIPSLVWAHLFGTSILFLVALSQWFVTGKLFYIPSSINEWGALIFFGVLQMIVYWLVYEGFGKGQIAVLNPIFASFSGIVAIISVLFFGEIVSNNLILVLLLVFGGVMMLNIDMKGLQSKRLNIVPGLREVGAATILAAVWTLGWDIVVGGHDFVSYAFFMYAFMTIAAFFIAKVKKEKLTHIKKDLWKYLILIGVGETIAYLGISYGYSQTSLTSVVALISGAFSLPTIILARVFLHEKTTRIQTVGSLIIIAGVILLAII